MIERCVVVMRLHYNVSAAANELTSCCVAVVVEPVATSLLLMLVLMLMLLLFLVLMLMLLVLELMLVLLRRSP